MDFEPLVVNCTEKQCRYLVNKWVYIFFNLSAGLACCAEFSKLCTFLYCCWEQFGPGKWCWILHSILVLVKEWILDTFESYPGGTRFESWLGHQLTEPRSFMVFLSPLKWISGCNLKFAHKFFFSIFYSSFIVIWCFDMMFRVHWQCLYKTGGRK